jgi:hypothetical protein
MSGSEEQLRQAVDDVLEAAWPEERRRASRQLVASTLWRAVGGVLVFWAMGAALTGFGFSLPWTFYAFIGGLTLVVALHEARDPDHLRHHGPPRSVADGR